MNSNLCGIEIQSDLMAYTLYLSILRGWKCQPSRFDGTCNNEQITFRLCGSQLQSQRLLIIFPLSIFFFTRLSEALMTLIFICRFLENWVVKRSHKPEVVILGCETRDSLWSGFRYDEFYTFSSPS